MELLKQEVGEVHDLIADCQPLTSEIGCNTLLTLMKDNLIGPRVPMAPKKVAVHETSTLNGSAGLCKDKKSSKTDLDKLRSDTHNKVSEATGATGFGKYRLAPRNLLTDFNRAKLHDEHDLETGEQKTKPKANVQPPTSTPAATEGDIVIVGHSANASAQSAHSVKRVTIRRGSDYETVSIVSSPVPAKRKRVTVVSQGASNLPKLSEHSNLEKCESNLESLEPPVLTTPPPPPSSPLLEPPVLAPSIIVHEPAVTAPRRKKEKTDTRRHADKPTSHARKPSAPLATSKPSSPPPTAPPPPPPLPPAPAAVAAGAPPARKKTPTLSSASAKSSGVTRTKSGDTRSSLQSDETTTRTTKRSKKPSSKHVATKLQVDPTSPQPILIPESPAKSVSSRSNSSACSVADKLDCKLNKSDKHVEKKAKKTGRLALGKKGNGEY